MTKADKRLGLPTLQERRARAATMRRPGRKKKRGKWGLRHVPGLWFGRIGRCRTTWYPTEKARDQAHDTLNRKDYYGYRWGVYEKI